MASHGLVRLPSVELFRQRVEKEVELCNGEKQTQLDELYKGISERSCKKKKY
jgi:hypothetical protein